MTDPGPSGLLHDVWRYPLFEALYGRRSRRFGLGFEITEGPFQYKSQRSPVPLSELSMSDADYHAGLVELSDEGLACTKAICNYIYDTYGKFPGTVDTMQLMWFMQVPHLDLDFYDRFFKAGAYGQTHAAHMSTWHS